MQESGNSTYLVLPLKASIFGGARSVVDPVTIFLTPNSITMQNFVAASLTVCACMWVVPENTGDGARLLGMRTWLTHITYPHPSPTIYHAKFGHCRSNHMGIGSKSQ